MRSSSGVIKHHTPFVSEISTPPSMSLLAHVALCLLQSLKQSPPSNRKRQQHRRHALSIALKTKMFLFVNHMFKGFLFGFTCVHLTLAVQLIELCSIYCIFFFGNFYSII